MSLQVIVPTCDKYIKLLPGFFHQWNKYCGIPGTVVCEQIAPKLPAGWAHFRAGRDTLQKAWVGNLRAVLDGIHNADVTMLVLDDYWLTKQSDVERIIALSDWMSAEFTIDKIDLTNDRMGFAHVEWDDNFVRSLPFAQYLTSTQAALWNTKFLRKCLANVAWNPWEFEIIGSQHIQNQKHKILGCRVPAIHYANVMLKGQRNQREESLLTIEDKLELIDIGSIKIGEQ